MTEAEGDWRDDPAWKLAAYEPDHYGTDRPADRPPKEAELAQPDSWASLYAGNLLVAIWSRVPAA